MVNVAPRRCYFRLLVVANRVANRLRRNRLIDARAEVARLTEEVAELRARLTEVQTDRDRWYEAAKAAREDARAEARSREAIERELRLALTTRS